MLTEEMKILCNFIHDEWKLRERFNFLCRIIVDAKAPVDIKKWPRLTKIIANVVMN